MLKINTVSFLPTFLMKRRNCFLWLSVFRNALLEFAFRTVINIWFWEVMAKQITSIEKPYVFHGTSISLNSSKECHKSLYKVSLSQHCL